MNDFHGTVTCSLRAFPTRGALTAAHAVALFTALVVVLAPAAAANGETATFYPDAGHGSTTVDGELEKGQVDVTFAAIRGAASANAVYPDADDIYAVYLSTSSTTNQYDVLIRSVFIFDTSAIPGNAIVTSATFSLYVTNNWDGLGGQSMCVTGSTPANDNNLVGTDYAQLGTAKYSSDASVSALSHPVYNAFPLNAAGIAAIGKGAGGKARLGLRITSDAENLEPSPYPGTDKTSYVSVYTADRGTNKPKLEVTYLLPTPTPTITPTPTVTPTMTPTPTHTPDVVPPAAPEITEFLYDTLSRVKEIRGTAEAGALVRVYDGAALIGTSSADGGGNWMYTPGSPLAAGQHSISAVAEDGAENLSPGSVRYALTQSVSANTFKDGAVRHSPGSSIGIEAAGYSEFKLAANSGAPVTVKAWVMKNAAYTGAAPKITLTGPGIDGTGAATASMTDGADAWEELSVTGTPTAQGVLTLRVETFSTAAGAKAWVDDISLMQE